MKRDIELEATLVAKYAVVAPVLDERSRRRWAAAESLAIGYGGDAVVSSATGVARETIRKGRREISRDEAPTDRIRRPGGGRPRIQQDQPGIQAALQALVDPLTRGDPTSPLRWTCKSRAKLAAALTEQGWRVSSTTVGRLLHRLGYRLQSPRKRQEGATHPDRNAQFEHINQTADEHLTAGQPVRGPERPSRSRSGKRVVVSLDGGRVRVRRKKRGPKTKKGRNRFHTDWKEPKLLILYVVGDDGRPSQTWAPIIDGTLRGPEAVFALLLSYARQIGLNAADKVLFIADGAPWIWRRLPRLIAALGLSPTQVLGLIDFYHAAKQLSDAVKLRRWSATQRTRWLNRTRGLLKRARVDEVITALRELCRGRTAGKIRTHLNYFLKNRHRFAYTTMVGLGLPRGSGAVESAIRRVINLRIKGASIYWLPESVDAILLLRSFYKSGRWNCLQRMAMTPVGVSA